MSKRSKISTQVIVFLVITAALAVVAGAAGGFMVIPNLPDNQRPETAGFFNLNVSAGQTQEITMTVENENDFDIAVEISLFTVGTNMNGIIDFTRPGDMDTTLAHDFNDIATLGIDNRLHIPAQSSAVVPVTLNIPAGGIDGMVFGAVHFLRDATDQELEEADMFINRFAHVMSVRLQEGDFAIDADFILGDVRAETRYYRAAIVADIRNPLPRMVMGALANAQVYQIGHDTPIFVINDMGVDFAPNAVLPMTMMDMEGFGVHPGDYLIRVQLEHEGRHWDFVQEFTVYPQEAAVINEAAVNQWEQAPPVVGAAASGQLSVWTVVAIAAGVMALIALVVLLALKQRASKRETEILMKKLQERETNR